MIQSSQTVSQMESSILVEYDTNPLHLQSEDVNLLSHITTKRLFH